MTTRRNKTETSTFGVAKRESHDASAFYARFQPPVLSNESTITPKSSWPIFDTVLDGSITNNKKYLADNSVALVVTSPPYFAGKAYETELGHNGIPATYTQYLQMLRDVFQTCVTALELGGRIAINVANLGRKPYRSLASDIISILQDDLQLLLRGEIIWQKAKGAGGNCAWGSFASASNPVLRDTTERIIIASKGRFDRALTRKQREKQDLPWENTIDKESFMENTLDVWQIPPESAKRIGHAAPFPVALPKRLIELYTYKHDLVLDPFIGSGTTAIAALQTGRHYLGFDTDPDSVQLAETRIKTYSDASL